MVRFTLSAAIAAALFCVCSDAAAQRTVDGAFVVTRIAKFEQPWAMTFLPDGRLLITQKTGELKVYSIGGKASDVTGVPKVAYGGQGGFGDVVLHPDFATNGLVYISFAEEEGKGSARGATVVRAKLTLNPDGGGRLSEKQVIWRQEPKVEGLGHYGHRLAFGPDGHLWITSGERQKFDPAQSMRQNLGKVIRLNEDGSVPDDNPFASQRGLAAQVWSLGHRNMLGIAFDANGQLWVAEMGPRGGDELNLIERGGNYGWPTVSNGEHYDGRPIPDHDTRPEFKAPKVTWTPVISPAGFIIYSGNAFPKWKGNGFIGGLTARALIRVELKGSEAREAQRFDMGERIREVEQGPDGNIWLLEDDRGGTGGYLLKLTPPAT